MLCLDRLHETCLAGDDETVSHCRDDWRVCATPAINPRRGTCVPPAYCSIASELDATCQFSDGSEYETPPPSRCPTWPGACQNGCGSCDTPIGGFVGGHLTCHGLSAERPFGVCGVQGQCAVGGHHNQGIPGQPSVCLVISNDGTFPEDRWGVMVYPETCLAYDAEFPEDVACFDQNGERID